LFLHLFFNYRCHIVLQERRKLHKYRWLSKNLTACQQDVFALLVPSCWQVWNKLFISSCNKVDEANRLATSCSNKSISSARNKLLTSWLQQARIATCYKQWDCNGRKDWVTIFLISRNTTF
jgi:hypothetical protein